MSMFFVFLILAFNCVISFLNARSVGRIWVDSKVMGGWIRLLAWSGAIQSAIGFSSIFLLIFGFIAFQLGYLSPQAIEAVASLWYLLIIIPLLGTGLAITIESWITAFRERSFMNMGLAAYNTFAQAKNMYDAVSSIPAAFGKISSFIGDGDWDDDPKSAIFFKIVLPLVLLALFSGFILTYVIVQKYAGTLSAPKVNEYQVKYD